MKTDKIDYAISFNFENDLIHNLFQTSIECFENRMRQGEIWH